MTHIRELLHSATPFVDELDVEVLRRGAGRRRVRRLAVTTIAVVLIVTGTTVALTASRHGGRRHVVVRGSSTTTAPSSTTPIFDTAGNGVDELSPPRLEGRAGAAVVWTGSRLVMWGGNFDAPNSGVEGPYRSFKDGAVYDPATRTWTPMAPSPLPIGEQAAGARTDDGIVFTQGRETAIWNPATNAWRKLGDAPASAFDLTFTGSLVVSYSANATLDTRTGVWRPLPEVPVQLARSTFAWTGHELVVIGGPGDPFRSAEAIALDPERREWRRIADPPPAVHAEALSAAWDGRRVVVANYDMRAIAYDPTSGRWTTLPSVPARFYEWTPTAVSVGGYTAVFTGRSIVVLTPDGLWVPLPYGRIPFGIVGSTRPSPDSTAGVMFVAGVRKDVSNAIAIVDLARLVAAAARLQVGVGSIQAPADYRLNASHYDDAGIQEVDLDFDGPHDASCSVKSAYTGVDPPTFPELVQESLVNDGATRTWYRNAQGTEWRTPPLSSDTFTITCSDPAVARQLAASTSFKSTS